MVIPVDFYRFESVWSAWGETNVFLIPVLLGLALLARRRPADAGGTRFFLLALGVMIVWRLGYAWSMRGSIRYQILPVILSIPLAAAGLTAPRRFFSSRRLAVAATVLLTAAVAVVSTMKNSRAPKSDKRLLMAAVVPVLREEARPGILWDDTSVGPRLVRELPGFEFVFEHHLQPDDAVFWRNFFEFIRKRQAERKALYLLLQTPRNSRGLEEFREASLREWGMAPFVSLCRHEDRNSRCELLRYQPPRDLFGLKCSTPEFPNPEGPFLPPEIRIRRGEAYRLDFSSILTDRRYFQWGGVEVDVRFGVADDFCWRFTPDAETPEQFPLEITLYAPNGWPTGYAATSVRVVDRPVDALPEREAVPREIDWRAKPEAWPRKLPVPAEVLGSASVPAPRFDELGNLPGDRGGPPPAFQVRMLTERQLEKPLFWIGSRSWGTPWITNQLGKANPKLRIFRLEEHPVLPYSRDPRYTFNDLSAFRPPRNPLLDERGLIDWGGYLRSQKLPSFSTIVLALGHEESMWLGGRTAFHVDHAAASLRRFLDAVRNDAPESRLLLILPGMPSLLQKDYEVLTADPYHSGCRWVRRHAYQRMIEAVWRVAEEYPELTVLPTYLWVPSGSDERNPLYRKIVHLYLQELEGEVRAI